MNLQSAGSSFYSLHQVFARAALLSIALTLPALAQTKLAADGPRPDQPTVVLKREIAPISVNFFPLPTDWSLLSQTKASQLFRDIERRANATNPIYPIVILDDDSINLRPISKHNEPTFRNRVQEILNDRDIQLRWNVKSDVIEALGGLGGPIRREPTAIRVRPDDYAASKNPLDAGVEQKPVCLVIPPVADLSSRTLVERWVGKAGENYMSARQDPGPYVMMMRSTWHEVWHCLDREFYRDQYIVRGDTALNNAHRMHVSETFADVGATLTLAMLGHLRSAQDMADIRAISSSWFARRSMRGARPSDEVYYEGVTYYLTRAQDLVDKHIHEVGANAVSRYTLDDIRRIAHDITLQGALSKEEFRQMADFYAAGAEPTDRVKKARQRMLTDTGQPVSTTRLLEDRDNYDVNAHLRDMPAEEKKAIKDIVQERAVQSIAAGKRPEQGILDLIEEWRHEIHNSIDRKSDFERKLYALSVMLSYGHLDKMLGRHIEKEKLEPPAEFLEPEIFKLPDFKLKYKWEPAPLDQAKVNFKLNLV